MIITTLFVTKDILCIFNHRYLILFIFNSVVVSKAIKDTTILYGFGL